jgi:pyridoxine 5-phosphate synthase
MAATQEMVKVAHALRPDEVTLVPERREELTTEGGLDVIRGRDTVARVVKTLRDAEVMVSLFIDPDPDQVKAAVRLEAHAIEIHTGRYCDARTPDDRRRELARIVDAAKTGAKLGLQVAAGHGLNYQNVLPVVAIREIEELNIGHAIVARALLVGFERAVREMKDLLSRGAP